MSQYKEILRSMEADPSLKTLGNLKILYRVAQREGHINPQLAADIRAFKEKYRRGPFSRLVESGELFVIPVIVQKCLDYTRDAGANLTMSFWLRSIRQEIDYDSGVNVLEALLSHPDSWIRSKAVDITHANDQNLFQEEDVFRLLARGIEDENPLVRENAAYSAGYHKMTSMIPLLFEIMKNDPYPGVRIEACSAINDIQGSRGRTDLVKLAMQDPHEGPRASGLSLISPFIHEEQLNLARAALDDPSETVRGVARNIVHNYSEYC